MADHARSPRFLSAAIGVAQLLAFGSSFYLVAVLAEPISRDTGWSLAWVVGGLSVALLTAGLISPRVGRAIERRGGRRVLPLAALAQAAGLTILAVSTSLPVYLLGWLVMGVAMGSGLYDAAFASLGRLLGEAARGPITGVTLIAGFASTVCWPLSVLLVDTVGWRGACLAYAGLALAVMLPLYLVAFPHEPERPRDPSRTLGPAPIGARDMRPFLLLAGAFTLGAAASSALSVHLLTMLVARGNTAGEAVAIGALLGPAQVAARLLEAVLGRGRHPVGTLIRSVSLVALGLAMMLVGGSTLVVVALGMIAYGSGSGLSSIARGTVPLAIHGPHGYAALMGRLASPGLLAQALAPVGAALILERVGATGTLVVIVAVAAAAVPPALLLARAARTPVRAP